MTGMKLSRQDRKLFGWVAAGALLAALLLAAIVVLEQPARTPDRAQVPVLRPSVPAQAEGQTDIKAQDRPAQDRIAQDGKVQERPVEPVGSVVPDRPVELAPPFLIVDGLTFTAGLNTYRLDNLTGPPATAACRNDDGHLWACGLQARAALNNVIQRKVLVCKPSRTDAGGVVQVLCTADGLDVGSQLTAQGWARPARDASDAYRSEARDAEQDRRGLWNGGWTFSGPG
jgi:endonuclease YncB( thermonuclease family)